VIEHLAPCHMYVQYIHTRVRIAEGPRLLICLSNVSSTTVSLGVSGVSTGAESITRHTDPQPYHRFHFTTFISSTANPQLVRCGTPA
jgi:hypothetical protein